MTDQKTSDEANEDNRSSIQRSDDRVQELTKLQEMTERHNKQKEHADRRDDLIKELKTQVTELTETNQLKNSEFEKLYSGEASKNKTVLEENGLLKEQVTELTSMVDNFKSEAVMKQFQDTALKTVKNRAKGELLLAGLHGTGQINMISEEGIEEAAGEAMKLLQDIDPSLFGSDGSKANGVAGNIPGARLNTSPALPVAGAYPIYPKRE